MIKCAIRVVYANAVTIYMYMYMYMCVPIVGLEKPVIPG